MKTINIKWSIMMVLLLFSIHATGQIRIPEGYLKFDIEDIEQIVSDYETKNDCCEGQKQEMRRACEFSKMVLMRQYKDKIIQSYDSTYFQNRDYYFLCFLGELPDSIVRIGMNSKDIPDVFKAQHGDTIALNKVLAQGQQCFFSNSNDEIVKNPDVKWPTLIANLLLIHNKKSMTLFYQILGSTKYGYYWLDPRIDHKIAVADIAIQTYLALYPPEKPISKINPEDFEVNEQHRVINSADDINQVDFKQYISDVEEYISKKEKHKVKIKTNYFNLGKYFDRKILIYE